MPVTTCIKHHPATTSSAEPFCGPEGGGRFATWPIDAALLLFAQILTGASLLLGGNRILTHQGRGLRLYLVSLVMVFFCTVALTMAAGAVALTLGRPRSDQHHQIDTVSRGSMP